MGLFDALGREEGYKSVKGKFWGLVFGVHEIDWDVLCI